MQGVAPGITLDASKVYANNDQTTTSAFLEAIDVDHVNVRNEEGGAFPDAHGTDPSGDQLDAIPYAYKAG